MSKIFDRMREPSSYAGLAAIVAGLGQIFKVDEAPGLAQVLTETGATVAQAPDGRTAAITAGITLALGLAAIFRPERGRE